MMRSLVVVASLLLVSLVLVPAASAGDSHHSPTNRSAVDPVLRSLLGELDLAEPYCQEILDKGREEGLLGNEAAEDQHMRFEWDHFEQQPACAELRDQLQYETGHEMQEVGYERSLYGLNKVAVGHPACDFGFVVGSGLVYLCWGGLNPRN